MSNVDPKMIAQQLAAAEAPRPGEVWRHYKGGYYAIVAAAVIEATLEPAVVYMSLKYETTWVRTLTDWREIVRVGDPGCYELMPRFRKVADSTDAWPSDLVEDKP